MTTNEPQQTDAPALILLVPYITATVALLLREEGSIGGKSCP